MSKEKVYLDSGVLIEAFRDRSTKAFEIIDSDIYEFYVSDAVYLEVMPKAKYHKSIEEITFYDMIFQNSHFIKWDLKAIEKARNLAESYGLDAMDAIHISHAINRNLDRIITTEKATKPMFKVREIQVESIKK